jgi:hypothetical protein
LRQLCRSGKNDLPPCHHAKDLTAGRYRGNETGGRSVGGETLVAAVSIIMGLGLGAAAVSRPMLDMDYRLPAAPSARDGCGPGDADSIIVCGRRDNDRYRVRDLEPPRGTALRRANPFDWDLGGGTRLLPTITQIDRPDGFVDRRIMLNIRIPF